MMSVGKNAVSGKILANLIERIERIRADKRQLGFDEAAVLAEAKGNGFSPAIIRYVVARRAKKPHDLQESEALADTYMNALGMATDAPLFRHVGMMSVDTAQRESVIEAMKQFVPDNGSITIEAGGKPVKLTRSESGDVLVAEIEPPRPVPPKASNGGGQPKASRPEPPACNADEAELLGRDAFKTNQPIIANPFPFGDARRPRWDMGWRDEGGGDGMGPDD